MRVSTVLLTAGVAVIVLSACSSAPRAGVGGLPPTGVGGSHVGAISPLLPTRGKASLILRKLYVTDNSNNDVAVFQYGSWTSLGTISSGVTRPYGDWVDRSGNLYVANNPEATSGSAGVTEYDSTGNAIFTYHGEMVYPVSVTTDKDGNVYVADKALGAVTEYPQQSDFPSAHCVLPYGQQPIGVAVNGRGSVFVTFRYPGSYPAGIIVYPRGLLHGPYVCTNAVLPLQRYQGTPEGLAFDKQGNLLVCDTTFQSVEIIAPPYNMITGTLGSGWVTPTFVTIDRAGTQVYVTDRGAKDVRVLTYPGGTNVATLGSANGLTDPISAVDSKNYVP
jgi:DNA-binding beta-propeller fold protein YncE